MSLDLGSPILDVAIGLAFVFFLLSLIASALSEAFASALKLRSKTLREGVEGMLGDQAFVSALFDHPLVRTDLTKAPPEPGTGPAAKKSEKKDGKEKPERGPSYLSPRNFALAVADLFDSGDWRRKAPERDGEEERSAAGPAPAAGSSGEEKEVSGKMETQLRAIGGDGVVPEIPELEKWFDDSMERVSGWYKRKSQWITVGIALVVALGLNASALRIAERLAAEPTVRAAVVAQAEAAAGDKEFSAEAKAGADGAESAGAGGLKAAGEDAESAYDKLDALNLPLFWAGENVPDRTLQGIAAAIVGYLLTVIAISLGAPFWFDTLGRLSNLRMAGKKPEAVPQQ